MAAKALHKNSHFSQLESRITRTEDAAQAVLHDSLYKQCTWVIYRGKVKLLPIIYNKELIKH